MSDIVKLLQGKKGFHALRPVSEAEILKAQAELDLTFADEYKEYVSQFGAVCYEGHELTGVCSSKRLNVAKATAEEKQNQPAIDTSWYVIEQASIDGITIWQNQAGEIYQSHPDMQPIKIANSLSEYVDSQ